MARVATGRPCPNDGSLVTCIGDDTSAILVGTCGCCGTTVETPNPHRIVPASAGVAAADGVSQEVYDAALARIAELESELAAAKTAAPEAAPVAAVVPPEGANGATS